MTATILFTDTDKIRSVIGLDQYDLTDDQLSNQFLDLAMMERLQDVMPDYETQYDNDTVGLIQNRLLLWCTYYGAQQVIKTMKLGIPQKVNADTDAIARFNLDLTKLQADIDEKVGWIEARLNPAYSYLTQYPAVMGKATPDYNPTFGPPGDRELQLLAQLYDPIRGAPLIWGWI